MFATSRVIDSGISDRIFGTSLFLLYLNDLNRSSEMSNLLNFDDDTTVFLYHPTSDALYVSFNEELSF